MNVALIHFADCPSAIKLDLLDIRNGLDVRRFSLDTKFITIAEHRHWVERVSADPLCLPFCVVEAASGFCHGCIFGVLADSDRQTCKVSFYLNHEARSLGIGASVVRSSAFVFPSLWRNLFLSLLCASISQRKDGLLNDQIVKHVLQGL
jgi:hypothetical protein